ncbi:hypothetical protein AVV44_gp244 [Cronobacter phage S13]|jgi:hypothetical protein|uniref:Uncharacterized protein n=1 Tax=Cronobacter phage LPCS28 TaxID=2924885 RepID=A0AAE9GBG2_9CAUD|nr:hypothetical protein AVV44_gp244 [Cronobacter phage S13]YP_010665777.1 hypothetical protein PQB73_gp247 [Cronobacter phage LPCS28]AIA64994.1 hypothetical protein S13_197 [Cronobacter phage S13]UNY46966.1 hypothetical protein EHEKIMEA_00083 [Cronobacter phage LPCS28]
MHVTELTEKQLRNMDTKRLNEVRKVLTQAVGKLGFVVESGNSSEADAKRYREVRDQHALVKEILSEREHIEKKKVKTPRRENKRDRVYDL